jgi:uncharacterized membrane protein YqaE (UPF0057 family)
MNRKITFILFALIAVFLGSCASSGSFSNGLVTKRKHNKGFHVNMNKKSSDVALKSSSSITTPEDENINFEELAVVSDYDVTSVPSEHLSTENSKTESEVSTLNPIHSETSASTVKAPKGVVRAAKREDLANTNMATPVFEATNKIKEQQKQQSSSWRADTVLLVILCFLLPPLAVYLYEGSWTSRCTVNLILTLLCGLPGIIHGLIVVLG